MIARRGLGGLRTARVAAQAPLAHPALSWDFNREVRHHVRSPLGGLWIVIGAVIAVLAISRLGRSIGPLGALLVIGLVVFVLNAGLRLSAATRNGRLDQFRRPTRNVTPREEALPPGIAARPSQDPTVVVVEAAERPSDDLAARLQALDRLKANGLVTESEYEAKRAQVIADF